MVLLQYARYIVALKTSAHRYTVKYVICVHQWESKKIILFEDICMLLHVKKNPINPFDLRFSKNIKEWKNNLRLQERRGLWPWVPFISRILNKQLGKKSIFFFFFFFFFFLPCQNSVENKIQYKVKNGRNIDKTIASLILALNPAYTLPDFNLLISFETWSPLEFDCCCHRVFVNKRWNRKWRILPITKNHNYDWSKFFLTKVILLIRFFSRATIKMY